MMILNSALTAFYMASDAFPFTINVNINLTDPIDLQKLQEAARAAQSRYPYFSVQMGIADDTYVLMPNSRPYVFFETAEGVKLGSAETNYHLLAFAVHDSTIDFLVFHGLTDGHGIFPFIKTVLYLYLSETTGQTLNVGAVRLPGETPFAPEFVDPYPANVPSSVEPFGRFVPEHVFRLPESTQEPCKKTFVYEITLPETAFMKYTRESDGSPATMVSAFLFKTIQSLHPDNTDLISCGMAFDRRGVLHTPDTFWSIAGVIHLGYKPDMASLPMTTLATISRGMVFLQSQPENSLVEIRGALAARDQLLKLSHNERKNALANRAAQSLGVDSFHVSYVGQSGFGDLERYITSLHPFTSATGSGILVEIAAVNGRFILSFLQDFRSDRYVSRFCELLCEEGIDCKPSAGSIVPLPGIALEVEK